ncbi:hypothetical protein D9M71_803710 [compost metagenome]
MALTACGTAQGGRGGLRGQCLQWLEMALQACDSVGVLRVERQPFGESLAGFGVRLMVDAHQPFGGLAADRGGQWIVHEPIPAASSQASRASTRSICTVRRETPRRVAIWV